MSLTIACDVDDVLADIMPTWLNRYNQDYGDTLTREQVTDWDIARFTKPECGSKIFTYLTDPSLYTDMAPVRHASFGIRYLQDMGHTVVFATACTYGMTDAKARWLERHGFALTAEYHTLPASMLVVNNKAHVRANVLIDDGAHNIMKWIATGRPAILFAQDHNKKFYVELADAPRQLVHRAPDWFAVTHQIDVLAQSILHSANPTP